MKSLTPEEAAEQRFLEQVFMAAREVWKGDTAEVRIMKNRNGASIFTTERTFYSIKLNK